MTTADAKARQATVLGCNTLAFLLAAALRSARDLGCRYCSARCAKVSLEGGLPEFPECRDSSCSSSATFARKVSIKRPQLRFLPLQRPYPIGVTPTFLGHNRNQHHRALSGGSFDADRAIGLYSTHA